MIIFVYIIVQNYLRVIKMQKQVLFILLSLNAVSLFYIYGYDLLFILIKLKP